MSSLRLVTSRFLAVVAAPLVGASVILSGPTGVERLEAADWTQWRGADREDHSPDTGLLKTWPEGGPKRVWLYENAGAGYGGPAIVDGKFFTLGIREDVNEVVICLDADTGKEIWVSDPIGELFTNRWGDGPRSTPTVDGEHLYVLGAKGDIVSLKAADGSRVWAKNLVSDFGGSVPGWGYCESPLVDGDRVICTPGGDQGALVALDKKTGEKIWQSSEFTDGAQYSSPIVVEHGGTRQYVQLVMNNFVGIEADSGKLLWKVGFDGRTAVIPTPIYHDGHVYVTAGYGVGCKLVKLGADGASAEEVYKNTVMVNHHGGVVRVGDHLYGHSDGGGWTCQDFKTGQEVWSEKDALRKGAIHFADGMLYCLEEDSGTVALIEASPEGWKEHGRFKLDPQSEIRKSSGRIWTHPVVVNGKLYLRDQDLIYCYDVKG